ncbi:MAG: TRAP transporter substrate-binding protein [Hyphomicrobiaceae bacterium]
MIDRRQFVPLVAGALAMGAAGLPSAHAQDVPELRIKIANSYTKDQTAGIALEHFKTRVGELSNGKITAQIFHAGTLYSEDKSIQAVLDGTVDMGLASASNHGPFTKVWRVMEAPYLFTSRKQFRAVIIRGDIGNGLRKAAEKDRLVPLMIFETGGFRILGTNRAVRVPDDMKSLKVRVPQSPVPLAFWKAAGANPTVVPWAETYLALGSKAVDGLDAAWVSWPLGKLWEVTKFVTDVKYSTVASVVDVSTDWWAKRTPKQKEIILAAAKEAEEASMKAEDNDEAKIRDQMKKNGMQVFDLTPEELEKWRKVGLSTWDALPDAPRAKIEEIQKAAAAVK